MGRMNAPLYSLNGGEVGEESLSRLDLERMQFASSLSENFINSVAGSITVRPGLEHKENINLGNVQFIEYSYAGSEQILLLLSNNAMRVVLNGSILKRVAVSTQFLNAAFNSFTGWTDSSTGGGQAYVDSGNLVLRGADFSTASARQSITVSGSDAGKEHAVRVVVTRGPVRFRLGTSLGGDDLVSESLLDDGVHSLAFTPPSGTIYAEVFHTATALRYVDDIRIEASGDLVIPTPWTSSDLASNPVRYRQVNDVTYVASFGYQQREIQRRGNTSWGIQRYKVGDGPFQTYTGNITLRNSITQGDGTLTASRSYFTPGMVGRLFRLYHSGQFVPNNFYGDNQFGDYIRLTGTSETNTLIGVTFTTSQRTFTVNISGTFTATITLEQALDDGTGNPTGWRKLSQFNSPTTTTFTDKEDNVIKFFRLVILSGDYTSGVISGSITHPGSSRVGVVRATGYVSPTVMEIETVGRLYNNIATSEWDYSVWSDYDGWPSAVEAFSGRVFWSGVNNVWGSVSDQYKSFSDVIEGDSAAIARSINTNADRGVLWLLGLLRLMAGSDSGEISIKSSSFDEPLTASGWFPVEASTRGCANLRAVKSDSDGIFVQASGVGLFRLSMDQRGDYSSFDLMALHADLCGGSRIVDIAVQRRPDTVIWIILENGEARALTYEPEERVIAWSRVITNGQITNVACSRGSGEDALYFAVVRNGTKRLEQAALYSDCQGGSINCIADGFYRFTVGSPQTTFSVPTLNGMQVVVWADGAPVHTMDNLYTVSGNQVILASPASNVVIGLPYAARWRSTKLAYAAQGGTALFIPKKVSQLGLYLVKTIVQGVRVGNSFSNLLRITTTKGDKPLTPNEFFSSYDADLMPIQSDWDTDSRVCIQTTAPYPCTIAAMVMDVKTNG